MEITYAIMEIIPNLSIDVALFGYIDGKLKVLLIRRKKNPEIKRWSLPGGYIKTDEAIKEAAERCLRELTGISNLFLSQVDLFSQPARYPERRVISVLFCALIKPEQFDLVAGSHAMNVKWITVDDSLHLPFDHNEMIDVSLAWFKREVWNKPIFINLLPDKFPLNEMQRLFEEFLNEPIDNRNFRKKLITQGLVERLDEKTAGGQQRPAFLYRLKEKV